MKLNSIKHYAVLLFILAACQAQNEAPLENDMSGQSQPEPCVCAEIYAPVCGADGVTYSNSCHAGCKGVEFTEGECSAQE